VRRFFCANPACERRTFAERWPALGKGAGATDAALDAHLAAAKPAASAGTAHGPLPASVAELALAMGNAEQRDTGTGSGEQATSTQAFQS